MYTRVHLSQCICTASCSLAVVVAAAAVIAIVIKVDLWSCGGWMWWIGKKGEERNQTLRDCCCALRHFLLLHYCQFHTVYSVQSVAARWYNKREEIAKNKLKPSACSTVVRSTHCRRRTRLNTRVCCRCRLRTTTARLMIETRVQHAEMNDIAFARSSLLPFPLGSKEARNEQTVEYTDSLGISSSIKVGCADAYAIYLRLCLCEE